MDPLEYRHWTDTRSLEAILAEQPGNKAQNMEYAKSVVHNYIGGVLGILDGFAEVSVPDEITQKLICAVRLVSRILGAAAVQDSGNRRALQVREMMRMFAFMRGRSVVAEPDYALAIKLTMSQLDPRTQGVLKFAMLAERRRRPWKMLELVQRIGGTRRLYLATLETLVDVDVLKQSGKTGNPGYNYEFSPAAMALVGRFDPGGRIMRLAEAPGELPPPEFDELVAEAGRGD